MSDPIEVFYHGCYNGPGHDLRRKKQPRLRHEDTPWGYTLDSGLLVEHKHYYGCNSTPDGTTKFHQKDGWSAVAFWDRSGGDERPGCNSVFLAHADITEAELLKLSREQWPEIFSRRNFPLKHL